MTKLILKDPVTGLYPNEEAFVHACLTMSQSDAYRAVHEQTNLRKLSNEQVHARAHKMAARPAVKARFRQVVNEAKIQDLASVGSTFRQLEEFIELAKTKNNLTAAAAFMRLKMGAQGMLKETIVLAPEQMLTDEEIIKRLAGTDPTLARVLKSKLGQEEKFAA